MSNLSHSIAIGTELADPPAASPLELPETAAPPMELTPLPEVLRQIGRDARKEAAQYLDETRAPGGGE